MVDKNEAIGAAVGAISYSLSSNVRAAISADLTAYGIAVVHFNRAGDVRCITPEYLSANGKGAAAASSDTGGHGGYDVEKAAQEAWHKHCHEKRAGLDSYAHGFQDAFKAGVAWAKRHEDVAPRQFEAFHHKQTIDAIEELRHQVHKLQLVSDGDSGVMRMLGSIENRLMEMNNLEGSRNSGLHDKLSTLNQTLDRWTNHKAVCDRDAILKTIVDVGQKVEAVLDQVMPHDVAEPEDERDNLDKLNDALSAEDKSRKALLAAGVPEDMLRPPLHIRPGSVIGVDLARPGSDFTVLSVMRPGLRIKEFKVYPFDPTSYLGMPSREEWKERQERIEELEKTVAGLKDEVEMWRSRARQANDSLTRLNELVIQKMLR